MTLNDSAQAYNDLLEEYISDNWSETESSQKIKEKGMREPQLIGGMRALQQRARYPEECKESRVQGRVLLHFIVSEQGQVINLKVTNGIHWTYTQEALRVIKTAGFLPALAYGKTIKTCISTNIAFRRPSSSNS